MLSVESVKFNVRRSLVSCRAAVNVPWIGSAHPCAGEWVDHDGMHSSLRTAYTDVVSHLSEHFRSCFGNAIRFDANVVGQPLMVEPRGGDGPCNRHLKIDDV